MTILGTLNVPRVVGKQSTMKRNAVSAKQFRVHHYMDGEVMESPNQARNEGMNNAMDRVEMQEDDLIRTENQSEHGSHGIIIPNNNGIMDHNIIVLKI